LFTILKNSQKIFDNKKKIKIKKARKNVRDSYQDNIIFQSLSFSEANGSYNHGWKILRFFRK